MKLVKGPSILRLEQPPKHVNNINIDSKILLTHEHVNKIPERHKLPESVTMFKGDDISPPRCVVFTRVFVNNYFVSDFRTPHECAPSELTGPKRDPQN